MTITSEWKILTPVDYRRMPWKNGGGVTEELMVYKEADPSKPFAWRLSIARIDSSGAFSEFSGYERLIVPLRGGTMTLLHPNEAPVQLQHLKPYRFDGSKKTDCTLNGEPAQDFNVMVRADYGRADIQTFSGSTSLCLNLGAGHALFYAVEGELRLNGQALSAGSLAYADIIHECEHFEISLDGSALFIAIRPT